MTSKENSADTGHSHGHDHDHPTGHGDMDVPLAVRSCGSDSHQHATGSHDHLDVPCCASAHEKITEPAGAALPAPSGAQSIQYRISNMDCPVEEKLIRNKFHGMQGIVRLDFNLMSRIVTVHHQLNEQDKIQAALRAIGMHAEALDSAAAATSREPESPALTSPQKLFLGISGLAAVAAEALAWNLHADSSPIVIGLALLSIVTGRLPILK